jgi:hypothetical protein
MAATRYWSVEECGWVDAPAADPVRVPEQPARLEDDEAPGLPRQRGLDELRSREGVEG